MSDFGREFARGPRPAEERLPWLDPIDDEPDRRAGIATGKIVLLLVLALVLVGAAVAAAYLFRGPGVVDGPAGAPGLIRAPEGDYKIKPDEPGGMDVEGQGDASYAASAGDDPVGRLDLGGVPEEPVRRAPTSPAAERPEPAPSVPTAVPATAAAPAGAGGLIQLGALPSERVANDAWKALSARFAVLQPFSPAITPVEVSGRTLYRLRVPTGSAGQARALCARLKVAGESCLVVD